MDIATIVVIVAAVAAFLVLRQMGQISPQRARELLASGAKVIDVRSPEEYASDHVKLAINIPLGDLENRIAKIAPDKSQPILLHCLSGARSGMAKGKLRAMGYTEVHNLGSLGRARSIVEQGP